MRSRALAAMAWVSTPGLEDSPLGLRVNEGSTPGRALIELWGKLPARPSDRASWQLARLIGQAGSLPHGPRPGLGRSHLGLDGGEAGAAPLRSIAVRRP